MIREIHRPETVEEVLVLLARTEPLTLPLGGGTILSRVRQPATEFAVVDLQRLALNHIIREGGMLRVGAAVTLEQLATCAELPDGMGAALRASLTAEAGLNLRQMATVAGTLVSCDGRSPFVTALLALDPRLVWADEVDADASRLTGDASRLTADAEAGRLSGEGLGDYLALRGDPLYSGRDSKTSGRARLMTEVRIPLNAGLRIESVARSPLDRPVVCVAVGSWPSGRTRVTVGGFGKAPILAMDGPEPVGAGAAAHDAYLFAGDAWASAEYRAHTAGVLAARLVKTPPGSTPPVSKSRSVDDDQ